ncbi:hypothetical protein [Streptomyces sp. NPDC096030]|uniref:hypothetical protein n=1 Tax=Streptomyces sp. NPDC096030 TaxID=3155423 RepID=UPI0033324586
MTDLLLRLASRASGRRPRPAPVPLLPPHPAAEPPSREHARTGQDATPEGVPGTAPSRNGEEDGRRTVTDRRPVDDRPVTAPPDAPYGSPPPVVRPAPGTPPPPALAADTAPHGLPGGDAARTDGRPTVPSPPPTAAPVPAPSGVAEATSALAPSVVRPAPAAEGRTPRVAAGEREPGEIRAQRLPAPPGQAGAPARRLREALGPPVARPVPVLPPPVPSAVIARHAGPVPVGSGAEPAPAVTISIGRVEIRAVPPAAHVPPEPDVPSPGGTGAGTGPLSLGDFLRGTGDVR